MRGLEFDLIVLDEFQLYPNGLDIFNKVILPTLLTRKGRCIIIGTPAGERNALNALFLKGKNNEPNWSSHHYTTYDNPLNTKESIDELIAGMPQAVIDEEILAIPSSGGRSPFGTSKLIRSNIINPLSNQNPVTIGIDIGRGDYTVIAGLDGSLLS